MAEISEEDLASVVSSAAKLLNEEGVEAKRRVGEWCLQKPGAAIMKELYNIPITVRNPSKIWHNRISRGLLIDTLDTLLGENPGHVQGLWHFYNRWRGRDGKFPYTYGERIFPEQWSDCVSMLKTNPTSRQANIVIRRPWDLKNTYTPCSISTQFYLDNTRRLNETWVMRSNDIALGGLPRNVFIGAILLSQMSLETGLPLGSYHQFDINLHNYTNKPDDLAYIDGLRLVSGPRMTPTLLTPKEKPFIKHFLDEYVSKGGVENPEVYSDNIEPYWLYWLSRICAGKYF